MVWCKKKIVKALLITETMLTINATFDKSPKANFEKKFPIKMNNGAPGECATCIFIDAAINSPQSQKLTVGATVMEYVINEIKKTIHPIMVFNLLLFMGFLICG